MTSTYNPANWYWIVGGSTTQVFASGRNQYVSNTDATYLAWAANNTATAIDTQANLYAALAAARPDLWFISCTRRQFFEQLAIQGVITETQALAAMAGTVPANLLAMVAALPSGQQFAAQIALAGNQTFYRNGPITLSAATVFGWTSAQIDTFFLAAGAL